MTFQQSRDRYNELRGQLHSQQLDLAGFTAQVQELRLQDRAGDWWCISPENGGWLRWDGAAWQPAQPSAADLTPEPAPSPAECPQCYQPLKPGRKFCGKCGAPVASQAAPASGRSAPAGATATAEIVIPAPKRRSKPKGRDGAAWGRATWNIISLGGCTAISGGWFWYSGMAETQPDYKTCAAIILLPLLTILLRKQIDRLLRPLQPTLNRMPKMVRLGIGLAIPLLMANYLYASGTREFDYLFRTVLVSGVLSYVILRVPSPLRMVARRATRMGMGI